MLSLVDGAESGALAVTDSTILRGDGCFEAIRSYDGRLFALGEHLDRLERSAAALRIAAPPRPDLEAWCRKVAEAGGDGVVRVVLSRGDAVPGGSDRPRCVVLHHPPTPGSPLLRLKPVTAPWHPAGRAWDLAGAKTISYAPNLSAGRAAQEGGWDDAVLVSDTGVVLEGPTFSVAWVLEGVVETPGLDLFILDSITRRHVLAAARDLGIEVREGRFPLRRMLAADEVMAMSTLKEVTPVVDVGGTPFEPGPVTARLAEGFRRRVDQEMSAQGGVAR